MGESVAASIVSAAANGTVTIILAAKPTAAPVTGDFTATSNIDAAGANALALAVTLGGNETAAQAFTVPHN